MTCHLKAKMSVSNNGKALDYISPLFDLKSSAMLGTECKSPKDNSIVF